MIRFIKLRKIYFVISGVALSICISSLLFWGLKPSIDFVGGALYEFKLTDHTEEVGSDQMGEQMSAVEGVNLSTIQYGKDSNTYILRMNSIDEAKKNEIKASLSDKNQSQIEDIRFETVGPTLGRELLIKTLMAVFIASLAIMGYVTYQFKDKVYGISAILAMFHDAIILLGSFSLLGYFLQVEVDTLFVTAVLTTLSFSVHDTIVVFDRIRETLNRNTSMRFEQVVDLAITDTFPRSLNNSLTIIFMLTCLFLLGGATIKWFAVALLIGTIAGTYSSPFVATPLLYVFSTKKFKLPFKKES